MNQSTRLRGTITNWKDDRGFGFISPDGGGKDVFVHISSLDNRSRRPESGDSVAYQVKTDSQGRRQASKVWFADEVARRSKSKRASLVHTLIVPGIFVGIVAGLVAVGKLPLLVLLLYLSTSIAAFIAYAWDKSAARGNRWRTSENTLHLLGLVGGWPGALVARRLIRHKSKKQSFIFAFWVTVVVNCLVLIWLLTPAGKSVLDLLMQVI